MKVNNVAKVATVVIITVAVPQVCKFVTNLFKKKPDSNVSVPEDSEDLVQTRCEHNLMETSVDENPLVLGQSSGVIYDGINADSTVAISSSTSVASAPTTVVVAHEPFLETDLSVSSSSSNALQPCNDVVDLVDERVVDCEQAPLAEVVTNLAGISTPEADDVTRLQLESTVSDERPVVSELGIAGSSVQAVHAEEGCRNYQEGWRGRGRGCRRSFGRGRGGRALGRGRGGRVGICLRCREQGHYAAECNKPFAPMLKTWPIRMKMIGCRIRADANVAIAWSD